MCTTLAHTKLSITPHIYPPYSPTHTPLQALKSRVQELEEKVEAGAELELKLHATEEANAVLCFEMESRQAELQKVVHENFDIIIYTYIHIYTLYDY